MRKLFFLILFFYVTICSCAADSIKEPVTAQKDTLHQKSIKSLPQLKDAYGISLSVYVYQRTLDSFAGKSAELAKAITDYGFTDVYLNFSNKQQQQKKELADDIRKLIAGLSVNDINVHALAFSEVNAIGDEQKETLEAFAHYQSLSSPKERFSGINFDIEPHIMRQNRVNWKKVSDKYNLQHIDWQSDKGYGKNGANSKVMQFVLDQIQDICQKAEGYNYIYSQAIGHFFEDKYHDGSLSAGGINDFLKPCDYVIIMNYTDDAQRLIRQSIQELTNAHKPRSVEIAVKTSDNGVGELNTSFADEGWTKMMETLVTLCEAAKTYPAFRGIGFFEYQSLEELWKLKGAPLPSTQKQP